jgi:nitroreductase
MQDSLFFRRKSLRSYLDTPVSRETLERVFEKTRWSPSPSNHQPWRFVVVTEPGQKAKFHDALSRGNEWAAKAPVLVAVCAREKDDGVRDDDPVKYYQFASGLATMALLLAAVDEGLLAHPMAGYDAPKLHEALSIPSEYHVMCIVSLGYQGPIELLDERTRKKDESPRTRKPMNEIVSYDRFDFCDPA